MLPCCQNSVMRTHVGAQIYWTFRRISHTHTPLSRRVVISRHFLRRPFEFDNLNIFLWAVILVYHNSLMQTLQSRVCIRYLGLKHYRFFFRFHGNPKRFFSPCSVIWKYNFIRIYSLFMLNGNRIPFFIPCYVQTVQWLTNSIYYKFNSSRKNEYIFYCIKQCIRRYKTEVSRALESTVRTFYNG